MITRAQQILLKRAQAQAGLDDADYRDAIEAVSGIPGCRSSKDSRLTDRHIDRVLAYMEAIFWRGVDSSTLQPSFRPDAVFRQRGYWASKNPAGNTSRDRFTEASLTGDVKRLEAALAELGYGPAYLRGIKARIGEFDLVNYRAALNRTLTAKQRAVAAVGQSDANPF